MAANEQKEKKHWKKEFFSEYLSIIRMNKLESSIVVSR